MTLISAKICPNLPAPPVETWDAFAVYERSGTRFGHCVYEDFTHSSPNLHVSHQKRTLTSSNQYSDQYRLTMTLDTAMTDIFVNITFSRYLSASDVNQGWDDAKPGVRTNQVYFSWLGANGASGDVVAKTLTVDYMPNHEQDLCIIDGIFAATEEEFQPKPDSKDDNFDPTTEEFLFGSHVWYKCGIARALEQSPGGDTQLVQDFYCEWSGAWSPTQDLMPCVCELFDEMLFLF